MYQVFGFYKFKKIKSLKKLKEELLTKLLKSDLRGNIILSPEGINGTITGKKQNINKFNKIIKSKIKISNFDSQNTSESKFQPFHKGKIKIKKEVVPMGIEVSQKDRVKKKYLNINKWNKLISDKKTLVIDARKPFEYEVGTFKSAVNPNIKHFRDFPNYLKKIKKTHPVAMFCTGGIRCEKASIYLNRKGFKNVFQLKGGILNYLKKTNKKNNLWKGECFVFDNRVSVKHNLNIGTYSICGGCRKPISITDKKSKKFERGVSCSKCRDSLSRSQIKRFRMRQKQIELAKKNKQKYLFQKEY